MTEAKAFSSHDHSGCQGAGLAHAERIAKERGLRLTPVRRRTLEILLEAHRAMGAYDVLQRLSAEGFGSQPPVAYRALEFLVENGLAHKIRRLNAFAACAHPGKAHAPAFFICEVCESVAEARAEGLSSALKDEADELGFELARMNVEAVGTCPACKSAP